MTPLNTPKLARKRQPLSINGVIADSPFAERWLIESEPHKMADGVLAWTLKFPGQPTLRVIPLSSKPDHGVLDIRNLLQVGSKSSRLLRFRQLYSTLIRAEPNTNGGVFAHEHLLMEISDRLATDSFGWNEVSWHALTALDDHFLYQLAPLMRGHDGEVFIAVPWPTISAIADVLPTVALRLEISLKVLDTLARQFPSEGLPRIVVKPALSPSESAETPSNERPLVI